jgi:hypothetical protein
MVSGGHGVLVLGAKDPLAYRQQHRILVAGSGRVPCSSSPASQLVAGGKGVRMFRPEDPLARGQQLRGLAAGSGRIPGLPGPTG